MSEAKEKDRILAQIKARKHHSEIVGLNKHIDEFVKDGYVSGSFATDGSIISIRITPQGERFVENGGYLRLYRNRVKQKLWYGFWFVMGVAVTKITEKLIDMLFP